MVDRSDGGKILEFAGEGFEVASKNFRTGLRDFATSFESVTVSFGTCVKRDQMIRRQSHFANMFGLCLQP